MGFKSLIAKQVQSAMQILGTDDDGLARKHTYLSVDEDSSTYNPVTRRVTSATAEYSGVPMVLVRFKIEDMDSEVRPKSDRRALIAALDLPVTPSPQDQIILTTGEIYNVVRLLSDPSDALHIAHIRFVEQGP